MCPITFGTHIIYETLKIEINTHPESTPDLSKIASQELELLKALRWQHSRYMVLRILSTS
jgi:hypothetical protein